MQNNCELIYIYILQRWSDGKSSISLFKCGLAIIKVQLATVRCSRWWLLSRDWKETAMVTSSITTPGTTARLCGACRQNVNFLFKIKSQTWFALWAQLCAVAGFLLVNVVAFSSLHFVHYDYFSLVVIPFNTSLMQMLEEKVPQTWFGGLVVLTIS